MGEAIADVIKRGGADVFAAQTFFRVVTRARRPPVLAVHISGNVRHTVVVAVIQTDGGVCHADELGDVVDVRNERSGFELKIADEAADTVQGDEAARGRHGTNGAIGDVAPMWHEGARVGVAVQHGAVAAVSADVERSLFVTVAEIHKDAGSMDGVHDTLAQRGQAAFVVSTTSDAVAAVVGEVDLPHTEAVVERDHVRGFQKRQRAFKVEAEGKFAARSDAFDVGGGIGKFEPIRFGYLATVTGDGGHDLRERIHIHADVDGEVAHAGVVVQAQLVDVGVAVQRQATVGVGVPVVIHMRLQDWVQRRYCHVFGRAAGMYFAANRASTRSFNHRSAVLHRKTAHYVNRRYRP